MRNLIMNSKEREQLILLEKLKNKEISQKEVAMKLKMTVQWVRKKFKRYIASGAKGLCHMNRGKPSKRRWGEEKKEQLIELLKGEWEGFGASFAAEKLGILYQTMVSKETVRKVMIQSGLHIPKQKRNKHRKRRERRAMRGMVVQLDGSFHDWFEGRGSWCTLLVFIDDATSEILWLDFVKSESNLAVMRATKRYTELHGLPHSFYVDYGKVFSVNLNNPERDKKTQWERALFELNIDVIHATSPQAKGRVERVNKTLQDRLVKELRLVQISSIADANTWLQDGNFLATHNQKFAVPAVHKGDAHRLATMHDLSEIFCLKNKRILANDFTISFNKTIFQLEKIQPTRLRPKEAIIIKTYLNGSIGLFVRKIKLSFSVIPHRPKKQVEETQIAVYKPRKPHPNSVLWKSGKYPLSPASTQRE
jgi:hypothetical protein